MERQLPTRLGPLSGLLVGVALAACAAASPPHTTSTDESRTAHTIAGPATAAPPSLRPSPRRASDGVGTESRAQAADARQTLHSPHLRAPTSSAAERVYAEVDRRTRTLDASLRARIAREILAEARRARLDPLLVVALIHVESSFDLDAVSRVGAAGLMQLRESTMADVAARSRLCSTDPLDPVANIQAGVRYLAALVQAFGDAELALMAYNAGPGRIRRYLRDGGVPERFRAYPRSIARELVRMGGALEPMPRSRLAVNDAPPTRLVPVRQANAPGSTAAWIRAHRPPSTGDEFVRAGPRGVERSREPDQSPRQQQYEPALASKTPGRGPRSMEGS